MKRFLACWLLLVCVPVMAAVRPPNIIIVLLDDFGLRDAGFAGNDFIETPALDQLAKDGIVFTQAYANAPNCAPSRAAIISGQAAPRTGVYTMLSGDVGDAAQRQVLTPKNNVFLPEQVYTLAELLRDHGYATAQIGKWNLGTGPVRGPQGQGFDLNIGGYRGGVGKSYFAPYAKELPNLQSAPAGEYLTDRLNREAVQFVQQQKGKPFFLYLSHFAPHFPIQAPAATKAKYEAKWKTLCAVKPVRPDCHAGSHYPEYAAMVEHVDRGLAQLRAALQAQGVADNTVIVLMSDNGGYVWGNGASALRGQKSQVYEGGLRVPMLWFVPGARAGAKNATPVSGLDIYPTLAALAGIDISRQVLDGHSIVSLFNGGSLPARDLYWYFPAYTADTPMEEVDSPEAVGTVLQKPAAVIQRDGWKLIRYYDGSAPELYYLPQDPQERDNRCASEKKRAAELMASLEAWLRATGGALSLPRNPAYSPAGH